MIRLATFVALVPVALTADACHLTAEALSYVVRRLR